MSEELVLSDQLINDVKAVLEKHDPQAKEGLIGVQYTAAIMGYMLGELNLPDDRKQTILDQLGGFAVDIMRQVEQRNSGTPVPPPPSAANAFGIWKPGMS